MIERDRERGKERETEREKQREREREREKDENVSFVTRTHISRVAPERDFWCTTRSVLDGQTFMRKRKRLTFSVDGSSFGESLLHDVRPSLAADDFVWNWKDSNEPATHFEEVKPTECQLGSIRRKHNVRWQHLSRIKDSLIDLLQKKNFYFERWRTQQAHIRDQ